MGKRIIRLRSSKETQGRKEEGRNGRKLKLLEEDEGMEGKGEGEKGRGRKRDAKG